MARSQESSRSAAVAIVRDGPDGPFQRGRASRNLGAASFRSVATKWRRIISRWALAHGSDIREPDASAVRAISVDAQDKCAQQERKVNVCSNVCSKERGCPKNSR